MSTRAGTLFLDLSTDNVLVVQHPISNANVVVTYRKVPGHVNWLDSDGDEVLIEIDAT